MSEKIVQAQENSACQKPSLYRTLFATCIGNALEWFDIAIYAFFVTYIAKAFFPAKMKRCH